MAGLQFVNVSKRFGEEIAAVKDFALEVHDKEFLVLVGPSGCGKSTTLRMVAGLEEISAGELYIGEKLVNDVPAKDRDVAMVFQGYALYPHMSVYENMAFGLKLRKLEKSGIERRVREAAKILGIEGLLHRKPAELSGGQQQRVALGRAMVKEPQVFLMDEPLSNLDAKLRGQMRMEIGRLHKRLEATFLYVTHDQMEAMTLGDRIAVMDYGMIRQVDTPQNVYLYPNHKFVAGFIGSPTMNFIEGRVVEKAGGLILDSGTFSLDIPQARGKVLREMGYIGREVTLGIRPEDIYPEKIHHEVILGEGVYRRTMYPEAGLTPLLQAVVDEIENMGTESYLHVLAESHPLTVRVKGPADFRVGQTVRFVLDMNRSHFFDGNTEEAIR